MLLYRCVGIVFLLFVMVASALELAPLLSLAVAGEESPGRIVETDVRVNRSRGIPWRTYLAEYEFVTRVRDVRRGRCAVTAGTFERLAVGDAARVRHVANASRIPGATDVFLAPLLLAFVVGAALLVVRFVRGAVGEIQAIRGRSEGSRWYVANHVAPPVILAVLIGTALGAFVVDAHRERTGSAAQR